MDAPPPPGQDPAANLLDVLRRELRRLHREAGEPSTRAIAKASGGVSHTTVHSTLRCLRLPRWGQLEMVAEALGGDLAFFRKLWVDVRNAQDGALISTRPAETPAVSTATGHAGSRSVAPWEDNGLRSRIAEAGMELRRSVPGQEAAAEKVRDALIRELLGFRIDIPEGRHRPRIVLLLGGPMGVGKSALIEAVSRLIYGGPEAIATFEMEDYSTSGARDRLVGIPSEGTNSYQGGTLTNRVVNLPESVLVFREIEKADARVIDLLFQIVEDGRCSDGAGRVVAFDQCSIFLTTNLGTSWVEEDEPPTYVELEANVLAAVSDYFTRQLQRPEVLSRITGRIVVLDYRRLDAMRELTERMLGSFVQKLHEEHGVELVFDGKAIASIHEIVRAAVRPNSGGRGIGSVLEMA